MTTIINFLFAAVKAGTPLIFGTTGEIITQKSGSLNLGVEGMMAMGAIGGFYYGAITGSLFVGLLAGFITAALGALIYAFLTVTLQANQNVTGLSLTIFGVGFYRFIGQTLVMSGNYPTMSQGLKDVLKDNPIPYLGEIPYIGKLFFSHGIIVYLAIIISILCWIYIRYTKVGLKVRAVGENPAAADASGVRVNLTKYLNIMLGGGICGLGGVYLALVVNGGAWNNNWINGMGWISIALVIFVGWSPLMAIFGSILFGMFRALQFRAVDLAGEFPRALGWLTNISADIYQMLPFLITAIVLIISSMSNKKQGKQPASIGLNYYREDR